MFNKSALIFATLAISFVSFTQASYALDTWEFKTGKGESVLVKKGLFGTRTVRLQDRLGNGYESDNSFFGSKKNAVSIMGNGVSVEKNIFGRNSIQGSTILGDRIQTKRSWFGLGPRKTSIDVSGVTSLAEKLLTKKQAPLGLSSPAPTKGLVDQKTYSDIGLDSNLEGQSGGNPAALPDSDGPIN
ncbi:MAG: hypothetical protein KIT34_08100 [Cyanobacteria bacterium TGS_CYA1]|nr:hypothetical protein [Cyanobacteria bacterium TGS_CYA1]